MLEKLAPGISAWTERGEPGTRVVRPPHEYSGSWEYVLTETMRHDEPVVALVLRLASRLREKQGEILGLMVYGWVKHQAEVYRVLHEVLGAANWPVTWVEGASCEGAPLAGIQAFVISGRPVTRIRIGQRVVGSVFEDESARHCLLGGLVPVAISLQPAVQVQQVFANLELALDFAGFSLSDVVRTWFFNEDILSWYGEFNHVRSLHYAGVPWRTGSLPASTGIGARNPAGAAVQVALWAVKPLLGASCAQEIASPLQCPAPAYGSSFSRAMKIDSGGLRRLLVSGTASIHADGRTAFVGDIRRQVDLTMEVVEAILRSQGMDFRDITRATAYYRHAADHSHFTAWLAEHGFPAMPVVHTHSVVCRADLLFEIELDACQVRE